MDKELVYKTISDYFSNQKVSKVYLFGSMAKGSDKESSDIDLIVYLMESVGLMKLIEYKLDLEERLHKKIDLHTPNSISKYMLPLIQKDWTLIYERK